MKYICPACDGPNEAQPGSKEIRCTWCGTTFSPQEVSVTEETAAASSDAAKASMEAAASVLEAAKKGGANMDPQWTADIIAGAAAAAASAAAAAKAAEAAAAAATAVGQSYNAASAQDRHSPREGNSA